jgi:hypothetical protein
LPDEEYFYSSLATLDKSSSGKPLHFGNYRALSQQLSTCDDDGMFRTANDSKQNEKENYLTKNPTTNETNSDDKNDVSSLTHRVQKMTSARERKSYLFLTSNSFYNTSEDDGSVVYTSVMGNIKKDSIPLIDDDDAEKKEERKGSFAKYLHLTPEDEEKMNSCSSPDSPDAITTQ